MRHILTILLLLSQTLMAKDTQTGTWWHWMNGHITREGITKDLEAMAANGISNATVLNCYRPFGSQFQAFEKYVAPENMRDIDESEWPTVTFGSQEWFDLFAWTLDEAERLGITIGTANCDGWSETGGPWIQPENSMKAYTYSKLAVTGASEFQSLPNGDIEIELSQPEYKAEYYQDVCVLAYPTLIKGDKQITTDDVIDITHYMDREGKLTLPASFQFSILSSQVKRFDILRFGYTTTGQHNHPASPEGAGFECDKMDTTALNLHFAHFPSQLLKAAGRHRGKTFGYFLVDSWECRLQTWAKQLPQEFEQRRGYSILPYLPVLAGDEIFDATTCSAFRHDYLQTLGEMIEEYFFKHLAHLCHQNDMKLYSEGIYGGKADIPACDVMATYKYCDVPMTEFWARLQAQQVPVYSKLERPFNHILPQHAALIYNKDILASEAYTGAAIYSESPWDLAPYANLAYAEGISKMMLHSYVHQIQERGPGFTLGIYGQAFNRLNYWFNESLSYWTWQERIQEQMQGAQRCADALLYIGDCRPANECKQEELDRLLPYGMKYQYINAEALAQTKTREGQLLLDLPHLQQHRYQFIVVRDTAVHLTTMRQLYALHQSGAKICGVKPKSSLRLQNHQEESAEVRNLADQIWGEQDFLPAPSMDWDVQLADRNDYRCIDYLHRKAGNEDRYFIANMTDYETKEFEVSFKGQGQRPALLLDPIDGQQYALNPEHDARYRLKLYPHQSVIVIFGKESSTLPSYAEEVLHPAIIDTIDITSAKGIMTFPSDATINPQKIRKFRSITEWDNPSVKYYSGIIEYEMTLSLPAQYLGNRIKLQIPAFGCTAHIWVNGQDCGTLWNPSQALEITSALSALSENTKGTCVIPLRIRVTNPWRNRLVGDLNQNRGNRSSLCTSPGIEKYGDIPYVRKDQVLLPAGISQGLRIIVQK